MTAQLSTPSQLELAHNAIVALTDAFCQAHLTQEYQTMCRRLAGVIAEENPSPLLRGKPAVWASAILRVIGRVNFLDLNTGMPPFMKLATIDKRLGVSSATSQSKAKLIRDLLNIRSFDINWTLPSLQDQGVRRLLLSYSPEFFDVVDRDNKATDGID